MRIKERFKFFILSFFSDNVARTAPEFGFGTLFLALLMSFLFFFCGYMGADTAPFSTHYSNAGQYKEFIHSAFENFTFETENGTARADVKINTYTSASDKAEYFKNGYNFIVDTRPANTLIEFTQVAVKGEEEISYEEYRGLSDTQQEGYKLKTVYADSELQLTEDKIRLFEAYLGGNEKASADYKKLKEAGCSAEEYKNKLYGLYVKYYYTGVSSVLYGASAPVLRDYYYKNYITAGNAYYFYVFSDMCAGSFETDGGVPVVFGGYYLKCGNQRVDGEGIDAFINKVYYDTAGYSATSYFISAVSLLPALIFIPLITAVLMWAVGKAVKNGWVKTFTGCLKTVSGFIWVPALITALITFLCGFFASAGLMYTLMPWLFAALLLIRTAVFCTVSAVKNKKQLEKDKQKFEEDIFGGNYET